MCHHTMQLHTIGNFQNKVMPQCVCSIGCCCAEDELDMASIHNIVGNADINGVDGFGFGV